MPVTHPYDISFLSTSTNPYSTHNWCPPSASSLSHLSLRDSQSSTNLPTSSSMMMSSALPNFMNMNIPYAFPSTSALSYPTNNFNPCSYNSYDFDSDHRNTSIAALRLKAREHCVALNGL